MCTAQLFFVWADCFIRHRMLLFEASPQCHHREPPNQVSHLADGTGNRKLVCNRPFAPLLRICSSPRAPSPICALLSGIQQLNNNAQLRTCALRQSTFSVCRLCLWAVRQMTRRFSMRTRLRFCLEVL